jgi:hypothetical protein
MTGPRFAAVALVPAVLLAAAAGWTSTGLPLVLAGWWVAGWIGWALAFGAAGGGRR